MRHLWNVKENKVVDWTSTRTCSTCSMPSARRTRRAATSWRPSLTSTYTARWSSKQWWPPSTTWRSAAHGFRSCVILPGFLKDKAKGASGYIATKTLNSIRSFFKLINKRTASFARSFFRSLFFRSHSTHTETNTQCIENPNKSTLCIYI